MDAQIASWELNLEPETETLLTIREEMAAWPAEPFVMDWSRINCN